MAQNGFVILFMLLWALFSARYLRRIDFFKGTSDVSLPHLSFWHLLGAFAVFFFTYAALVPMVRKFLAPPISLEVLGLLLFTLAFFAYCLAVGHRLLPYFKNKGFFLGASSWFLIYPFIFLWATLIDYVLVHGLNYTPQIQVAINFLKENQDKPLLFITLIFFVIFIVPAIEEILFRGFLQSWLRSFMEPPYAIGLTALIFAFFHYSPQQGLSNITILSSLFILATFLGFLMEKTKSLRTPIGLHATFNALSILFIFLKGEP